MTPLTVLRITNLVVGALIASLCWLMPRLTRPDLYFAVTVTPAFPASPEALSILRRYRRELLAVSGLALAGIVACDYGPAPRATPLILVAQLAGSFLVFSRARARVLPHAIAPTSIREAEARYRPRGIPGGWLAACMPYVLIGAAAAYLWIHWQQIPLRFPVHWGLDGLPDRWAARSLRSVYLPLLSTVAALIPLTLLLYGITYWLRSIQTSGLPGVRESIFRRTASLILLAAEYLISLQASWIALHPLFPGFRLTGPAGLGTLLLPLLVLIVLVVTLARLGQGGSRLPPAEQQQTSMRPIGDRIEDRHWLLGVIYFNPADPAVVVEKRFGIGYTLNFARPMAWTIILLAVLLPVALTRLLH
jgi:uncharacterized membrane protein